MPDGRARVNRVLTEKQFLKLAALGSCAAVVAPGKRDWAPLLRHGYVAPAWTVTTDGLPPLRITPDGWRALADWADQNNWNPNYGPNKEATR